MDKQEFEEAEKTAWLQLGSITSSQTAQLTLAEGFREAYSIYVQWLEYNQFAYYFGQKGFNQEVMKLHKALIKLQSNKGTKQAALKSIDSAINGIDETYLNSFDTFLSDHQPTDKAGSFTRYIRALSEPDSNKPELLERLTAVTQLVLENLSSPGRGKRKLKAVQYVEPMERLKTYFQEAMPNSSQSAKRGTLLEKYIYIWLRHYAKTNTRDAERIIQKVSSP